METEYNYVRELEGIIVPCEVPVMVSEDDLRGVLRQVEVFVQQNLSNGLLHGARGVFRPTVIHRAFYFMVLIYSCGSEAWETRTALK